MINRLSVNIMKNLNYKNMKKLKLIAILTLIVVLCCGCGENDETKIEKAMKDYVGVNFSYPKHYKGIVSMTIVDTIDFAMIAKMAIDDQTIVDSICNKKLQSIYQLDEKTREIRETITSWSYGVLIDDARDKLVNSIENISIIEDQCQDSLCCAKIDSLLKYDSFELVRHYNVKVKTIQQGEVEYVFKDYSAFVSDHSCALITDFSELDVNNLKSIHMRKQKGLNLLVQYTSELLETRMEKLNAIQQGEDAAKRAADLCLKCRFDY